MKAPAIKKITETLREKIDIAETKVAVHLPEETTLTDVEEWSDCVEDTITEAIE